eukprot:scaffold5131_cov75-Cylindrotheca_fusiformis.AAC.1
MNCVVGTPIPETEKADNFGSLFQPILQLLGTFLVVINGMHTIKYPTARLPNNAATRLLLAHSSLNQIRHMP